MRRRRPLVARYRATGLFSGRMWLVIHSLPVLFWRKAQRSRRMDMCTAECTGTGTKLYIYIYIFNASKTYHLSIIF